MQTPRSYTETCTAMSKPSLGRASLCPLPSESPVSSQIVAIWPTVPTGTTTLVNALSPLLLHLNSFGVANPASAQSFGMSLPMLPSSILGSMSYAKWQHLTGKPCPEALNGEPTGSLRLSGMNPFTMTISSSKPSIEGPDHDPDTWGSKDTP